MVDATNFDQYMTPMISVNVVTHDRHLAKMGNPHFALLE